MKANPLDRFVVKIKTLRNGCWQWTGAINKYGYGSFRGYNSKDTKSHIFSYEHFKGKIKVGFQLDHLCRNRACCNPNHLQQVTAKENQMRAIPFRKTKTNCPNGHSLTEDNILFNKNSKSGKRYRICKKCRLLSINKSRDKKIQEIWLEGFNAGLAAKNNTPT